MQSLVNLKGKTLYLQLFRAFLWLLRVKDLHNFPPCVMAAILEKRSALCNLALNCLRLIIDG